MPAPDDCWPHAPPHWTFSAGTYFVTASTYRKEHHFRTRKWLRFLHDKLLEKADEFDWALEAWAVFSNHYHFVAKSPDESADSLGRFLKSLHGATAVYANREDETPGRKVWHNYRDSHLTYQKSYYSRLNYTHQNPVKHGLVSVANQYDWCSAAWFESNASSAQVKTIYSFKTDTIEVDDDFEPFQG